MLSILGLVSFTLWVMSIFSKIVFVVTVFSKFLGENTPTIATFLTYATGAGALVVASFLLNRLSWFNKQTSSNRQLIVVGTAIVVAFILLSVKLYASQDILAAIQPYFESVATIATAYGILRVAHKVDPSNENNILDNPEDDITGQPLL